MQGTVGEERRGVYLGTHPSRHLQGRPRPDASSISSNPDEPDKYFRLPCVYLFWSNVVFLRTSRPVSAHQLQRPLQSTTDIITHPNEPPREAGVPPVVKFMR